MPRKLHRPGPRSAKAATPIGPGTPVTTAKRGRVANATAFATQTRSGKYNAKGRRIDGIWFASEAEAIRYVQLKEMQDKGMIDKLSTQVSFRCTVNGKLICTYRADFQYMTLDDRGSSIDRVVEDVKGMITDVYRIKKKLVEAIFSFEIKEIPSKSLRVFKHLLPEET
jgi:hypothetical protein